MRVRIDTEVCVGFGICIGVAPEVFELSEDGYAVVLAAGASPEHADAIRRAASQCPAQAIQVDEADPPG